MTTAVASPPVTAPHAPPAEGVGSARTYAPIAPLTSPPHAVTPSKSSKLVADNASPTSSTDGTSAQQRADGKPSMSPPMQDASSNRKPSSRLRSAQAPKIVVKKEPSSPDMTSSRHRPRRLDLSTNSHIVHTSGALTSRPDPMSSKGSASIIDVGLACLSPGFHTQDPTMREQLQRSIDVRERQRQIIEARQKQGKGGNADEESAQMTPFGRAMKTPSTSRRKGPPPGLSIAPPSHQQFANERVIQSAPINQSFTGLRPNIPPSRHAANGPSNLSQTSHIHHVPATQTNNRLPPISDVFPEPLGAPRNPFNNSPGHSSHSNNQPPLPSPSFPPQQQQAPQPARRREYSSAEEAVQSLSGGREDLLPRIVHYGGHQPPTPPSPMPKQNASSSYAPANAETHRSSSSRRRGRDEYERDNGTPPLGRQQPRTGPFGEGRDTPETQRRKKEEFIQLCSRAWDLFHS
ncbi:uncharacterized protein EI97DRAFT_478332 [Westerdykella ornata]|uniref:Uncharacterized protein n=1 Tax=Westerdykella ornata TaxID=318751 RepID=A0A6A6JVH3_WESOR|nr:uncharacterized protein EI97DRAFT_478332 [Westerdykella ornata]KAF2280387.1 hypothetical protein EI97DRAFT_478332 [Westerdykella ornata]